MQMRMRFNYNHLLENIGEMLSVSRSKFARENGFGIEIGLNLLTSYLKEIAERAIEINDDVLIGLLLDMHILKEEGGNE